MPNFSPEEQFKVLKSKVIDAYKDSLNLKTKKHEIKVDDIYVDDAKDSNDIEGQRQAVLKGQSWQVPIRAKLTLYENGKKKEKADVVVGHLPKVTDRLGYIVKGNEYQSANLLRLRPGVYHRRNQAGKLFSEFNLGNRDQFIKGKSFKLHFDPKEAKFELLTGNRKMNLLPLMYDLGYTDRDLEKAWGKEVLEKNKKLRGSTIAAGRKKLADAVGAAPEPGLFKALLDKTEVDPETTSTTVGKSFSKVTPDMLVRSTKRLLGMSRGEDLGDDKGDLKYLSVHSAEDLISNRIKESAYRAKNKMKFNLERKRKSLKEAIPVRDFDRAIQGFFNTSLARQGDQTNPLEMLSGHRKTTLMGEQGGIQSSHAVLQESKLVNPSHLGFLDPIETPEGERTGISLALSTGANKVGNKLKARFVNAKSNKKVLLTPKEATTAIVGLPDQYTLKKGKYVANKGKVQAIKNGEIAEVNAKDVDYILPSPRALFGSASNLIPFLQNNHGNRAMTAVRQQAQASPLVNREAPLVQVKGDAGKTFEEIFGQFSSSRAPVSGKVKEVRKNEIVIQKGRKTVKVPIYRNYPLKGHSLYDSEVLVKKGDKVKEGDLLADTTFTRGGSLALGTNLKTAYMPFKGYNFEDGLVISESAAKKLTSEHIYPKNTNIKGDVLLDKTKYTHEYPYTFNKKQIENIGKDGIVRIGATVNPGDPLVLKLKKPEKGEYLRKRKKFSGGRALKYRDRSLVWGKDTTGVVTDIVKKRDGDVVVYIKTKEPAVQGDKLVGRHGNKGIITRIIPDNEMPFKINAKGEKEKMDIILNPLGVPGRINLGQVLETVAGKIAQKKGEVYKVKNFEAGKDYLESLKKETKAAGVKDRETLYDPTTGKAYKQPVLEGNQYIFKLKHQVQKKMNARSGGPGMPYNINHAPTGGTPHGGSTIGELGLYGMLAHGARKNLHEMFTYKSNKNDDVWDALREGTPLPPPKVPFAFEKFLGYMNGLRVNVKKEGHHLQLMPFKEDQITGKNGLSAGELKKPGELLRGKDLKEIPGGLFDADITGGLNGTNWSHVKLSEEIPNPMFEEAITKILDLKRGDIEKIVSGEKKLDGKTGGAAIRARLAAMDLTKEREKLEKAVRSQKKTGKDKALKKLKIVRALQENKLDPTVYMMKSLPILPPHFRPLTIKENGDISANDLNGLYKDVGAVNDLLTMQKNVGMPGVKLIKPRKELYEGVKAVMGLGGSLTRHGKYRGIVDIISGKTREHTGKASGGSAKTGYFHTNLLKRRQDYSARSTIIPEPKMGLDEVGLPEGIAWTLYEPFIQRKLLQTGLSRDEAEDNYKRKTPLAQKAMEKVVGDRPVLLKRDPVLHKHNIMAFKPRLIKGKAIEIHPLTVGGFNADFDGDTMAVYLPITAGAVKESYGMYPSNNLFSATTGAIQYTPGHEALLGLYLASKPGKKTNKKFTSFAQAQSAHRRGQIDMTDIIKVNNKETTLGRMEIESVLPKELRETGRKPVSSMKIFNKNNTKDVLTHIAKKHPLKYGMVSNKFKDIGNEYSTSLGFSIGLDDFSTVNKQLRDNLIAKANSKADTIRRTVRNKNQQYKQIVQEFQKVDEELDKANTKSLGLKPTNIYKMVVSGARGKPSQLKQIVSSPILVKDGMDRVVPYLIPKSYSEGMDIGSYWTTMHGARKGTIQKVQGVRDPGYITKQIQNSVMNMLVTERDCGTKEGIWLSVDNPDIADRRVLSPTKFKGLRMGRNDLITANTISTARKAGRSRIKVRSALRCESDHGVCQMCSGNSVSGGKLDIGTNIGIISGHAIGEPSTQLSMNAFHTGGLAKGRASDSQSMFKKLSDYLRLPKQFPDAAVLAPISGKVTSIKKAPQGGFDLKIGNKQEYIPSGRDLTVSLGMDVKKGDQLSSGTVNPVDLLGKTNIVRVQDKLTDDVYGLLKKVTPIRRRNVEVVVKAMTNITKVVDPSKHDRMLPGDIVPTSKVKAWNKRNPGKEIKHEPIMKGINVLPHAVSEDWMARLGYDNINRTLTEAAREGWKSNIHGFHPIPAVAFAKDFGIKSRIGAEEWKGQY